MKVVEPSAARRVEVRAPLSCLRRDACGVGRSPTLPEAISMHAGLSSHMLRVQASRGQQCTSAARSCSLQAVAAACSRCRKHPNADPLANARRASPGGLSGASLHGQLVLVEQRCSRSSSLSATLFRAAAKAFAQLCTSCLPACLLHAAEIGPDARCMWRPTQLLCACPDPC